MMQHSSQRRQGSKARSRRLAMVGRVQQPRVHSSQQSRRLEVRLQAAALKRRRERKMRHARAGRACAAWQSRRRAALATAARMREQGLMRPTRS